ncbi:kinase domain protein, partial (macronuclear) [Tetrahymena thermophila SB210]
LIKPACHLLTCLFIYLLTNLLTKQNITNFFTYSSQHNQNTNEAIVFYHPFSSIFIQFVIYSYISRYNNIGAEGAKDLGTGIAQCKNITTLTLSLYQLSQLVIYQLAYSFIYLLTYQPNKIQRISLLTHHNTTIILTKAIVFYHPFSSIFIQFVIYSYISRQNKIGAKGAKDLGTGIAQCKNITTLTLNL